jgi:hypothetical protein
VASSQGPLTLSPFAPLSSRLSHAEPVARPCRARRPALQEEPAKDTMLHGLFFTPLLSGCALAICTPLLSGSPIAICTPLLSGSPMAIFTPLLSGSPMAAIAICIPLLSGNASAIYIPLRSGYYLSATRLPRNPSPHPPKLQIPLPYGKGRQ